MNIAASEPVRWWSHEKPGQKLSDRFPESGCPRRKSAIHGSGTDNGRCPFAQAAATAIGCDHPLPAPRAESVNQGPQGPQGERGPEGAVGPQGEMGQQGPQGPQGVTGLAGAKGDTGAAGPQGPQGLTGATGATGPQGPQGPKGDTGATGPEGAAGASGSNAYRWPVGQDRRSANRKIPGALPPGHIGDLSCPGIAGGLVQLMVVPGRIPLCDGCSADRRAGIGGESSSGESAGCCRLETRRTDGARDTVGQRRRSRVPRSFQHLRTHQNGDNCVAWCSSQA